MLEDAYYSSGTNKEGNLKEVTTKEKYIVMKDAINSNVVDYKIYGNSKQETRSGKNLFDYDNINSVTYEKKENNGFYRQAPYIMFGTYETLENYMGETVTISFDLETSETGEFLVYQYQSNGIGIKFPLLRKEMEANKKERISVTGEVSVLGTNDSYSPGEIIIYKSGYAGSYTVSNIQFELGEEATSYEKYGKTPSLEIPSEIESVGDLITSSNCSAYGSNACNNVGKYAIPIKVSGKNLINKPDTQSVQNNDWYSQIIIYDHTAGFADVSKALEKGQVYLSYDIEGTNADKFSKEVIIYYRTTSNENKYADLYQSRSDYKSLIALYIRARSNSSKYNGTVIKFSNIQIEEGTEVTSYEPYVEPKVINIYLNEPLRKVGDAVDYIDLKNKQVVRNVKVNDTTGTKSINESYSKQDSTKEDISLPDINLFEGYNKVSINTKTTPSKFDISYKKK